MRFNHGALLVACVVLAAVWPLPPAYGQRELPAQRKPAVAPAEGDEQSVKDSATPPEGDAVEDSSPEPLVPGKWLTTSDEQRNQTFKEMKQVAVKSGADIVPIESKHVTLWAAEDIQRAYLPDVQKMEKFFHAKCAEPLRSGLDKRSTHVVLLKDRAEYQAWCQAAFDLFGHRFDVKDAAGDANAHNRRETLKLSAFFCWDFVAISLENPPIDWRRLKINPKERQILERPEFEVSWRQFLERELLNRRRGRPPGNRVHREVVGGVASIYFSQLAEPRHRWRFGPLQDGIHQLGGVRHVSISEHHVCQGRLRRGDAGAWRGRTRVEAAGPTADDNEQGDAAGHARANG